jgi:hypothetical protein
MRELGKGLIGAGLLIAAVGAAIYFTPRMPTRLGRLPGDIVYRGRNTTVYFPVVTCVVVSLVLTLLSWLVGYFRK